MAVVVASCAALACAGPRPPERPRPSDESAPAARAEPGSTIPAAGCEAETRELLARIATSRARPCHIASDCAAIAGPRSPAAENKVIVHALDRAALEAQVRAHHAACPPDAVHEPSNTFRTIEAQCGDRGSCEELETIYHIDDPAR